MPSSEKSRSAFEFWDKKANILGLLCADGNYRVYTSHSKEFDNRRNCSYKRIRTVRVMEFSNTNLVLLKHFQNLLAASYNYRPKIILSNRNVFRVSITKKAIMDDILKDVVLGNNKWFVPVFVLNGTDSFKINFIKGYFDGDGCVDSTKGGTPRIRFSSTNLSGLKQVKQLLDDLNIHNNLNGPYKRKGKKDSYELLLRKNGIEKFIKEIKSEHSKKNTRLEQMAKLMPR